MRGTLDAASNFWFWVLVVSTIAVAIGIICEAPEVWLAVGLGRRTVARVRSFWYVRIKKINFNGWERVCPELIARNDRHPKWVAIWGLIGWTLVAGGVVGEGIAEYFVNDTETDLRAFDHAVLVETQSSSNSAANAASLANTFANKAVAASDKATAAASSALTLATGARQEADSFEAKIDDARTMASDAKAHIADAFKQATDATAALNRLKSPRIILHVFEVVALLKAFKGTEYSFASVCAEEECIDLLKQLDSMLEQSEWRRVNGPGGINAINPYGKSDPLSVPQALTAGLLVQVESPNSLQSLQAQDAGTLPPYIRAAIALNLNLANNLSPPDDKQKPVGVVPGTATVVSILVGKKQ